MHGGVVWFCHKLQRSVALYIHTYIYIYIYIYSLLSEKFIHFVNRSTGEYDFYTLKPILTYTTIYVYKACMNINIKQAISYIRVTEREMQI